MAVAIYVHLQPGVPASVLPLGIKPPVIPGFVLLLGLLTAFDVWKQLRAVKDSDIADSIIEIHQPMEQACRTCMSSSPPTHHKQPTASLNQQEHKMPNLFEPVQLGSLVLANRVFMAPAHAQPRRCRWGARRTRGNLLLATRFGWTHRDRGDANLAHGQRLHQYSRDSFPRAGASVEPNRRIRSSEWRPNLSSVVACRPNLSFVLVAEQRATRCSLRNPCQ